MQRKMAFALKCTVLCFTVLWSLTAILRTIVVILMNPFAAFKKKTRNSEQNITYNFLKDFLPLATNFVPFIYSVPPACLLDPSLGTHEYVTANGIKFHYVAAGDRSKPLMLFLHGFPEVSNMGT